MSELTPNLGLFKYSTDLDGKQVFSIDTALNDNWDILDEKVGSGVPFGTILTLAIPPTTAESEYIRRLDGSTIYFDGSLAQAYTRLSEASTLYPQLFCTQDEYHASISTYGECGKFVLTSSSVKLPTITSFIQGLSSLDDLASMVEAGLPNITGTLNIVGLDAGYSTSGAFNATTTQSNSYAAHNSGTKTIPLPKFDASLSNSIYGNSDTVQPQAIRYPYYIVLGTTSSFDIEILNDIEVIGDQFPIMTQHYSDHLLDSGMWLRSNGSYYTKAVYPDAYDYLLTELNNATSDLIIKNLTDITDEDNCFVVDTINEKFKFPSNVSSILVRKGTIDGVDFELYSDGKLWCQGVVTEASVTGTSQTFTLPFSYDNTDYHATKTTYTTSTSSVYNERSSGGVINTKTESSITIYLDSTDTQSPTWQTMGYTTPPEDIYDPNKYLYFKVANAVQNVSLMNASRIEETKADVNGLNMVNQLSSTASTYFTGLTFPSNRYEDLTYVSGQYYTAPAHGYYMAACYGVDVSISLAANNIMNRVYGRHASSVSGIYLPVEKGAQVVSYGTASNVTIFRFIYAQGSSQEDN